MGARGKSAGLWIGVSAIRWTAEGDPRFYKWRIRRRFNPDCSTVWVVCESISICIDSILTRVFFHATCKTGGKSATFARARGAPERSKDETRGVHTRARLVRAGCHSEMAESARVISPATRPMHTTARRAGLAALRMRHGASAAHAWSALASPGSPVASPGAWLGGCTARASPGRSARDAARRGIVASAASRNGASSTVDPRPRRERASARVVVFRARSSARALALPAFA